MTTKIKTRVLVLSDTHGARPEKSTSQHVPYRTPLPEADVTIHTGDLTMTGTREESEAALDLLTSLQSPTKLVIPGNHDLTLDRDFYIPKRDQRDWRTRCTDADLEYIRNLYTSDAAKATGIQYIEEGLHSFRLANGAALTVYASAYTPEFCDWAFAYPRSEDRFNLPTATHPVPGFGQTLAASVHHHGIHARRDVDILMTHGPPAMILDETLRGENVGCEHLMAAVSRCRPLLHCFGHIHEGWGARRRRWSDEHQSSAVDHFRDVPAVALSGDDAHRWQPVDSMSSDTWLEVDDAVVARDMGVVVDATGLERGAETLFVNASIMSLRYKPVQGPWLIDLLLDRD